MNREHLQEQIRTAAIRFTDEVVHFFGEALSSIAQDLTTQMRPARAAKELPRAARPQAKEPLAVKAAPVAVPTAKKVEKRAPAKPSRRSSMELENAAEKVIELLTSRQDGMRIEEINKALGTSTRELMRPIKKLLANKQIRKTGERRSTTYYRA